MQIWFTKGFTNLFHAINDIKKEIKDVKVLCSHSHNSFLGFQSADWIEEEPEFKNIEDFLKYTINIIKKYNIKLIFPHHHQEWFNLHKKTFNDLGVVIATVGEKGMVNNINFKHVFYSKISKIKNINYPKAKSFSSIEEFKNLINSNEFKNISLCMKPSFGVYGSDFLKLRKNTSLSKIKSLIQRNKRMVLMEFLDGLEYSADCVAFNGKLIGTCIRKKISSNKPQIIVDNKEIEQQVIQLTKHLKLNGMFNIQFKEKNGVPYILEINPRLSGRSYYATLAGFNIPAIASKLFLNLEKPQNIKYQINHGLQIANINSGVAISKSFNSNSNLDKESQ